LYPHGEITQDELAELVELALEGRRRVKAPRKKMGSFEYDQTSFSYILCSPHAPLFCPSRVRDSPHHASERQVLAALLSCSNAGSTKQQASEQPLTLIDAEAAHMSFPL
jgi:hypothetical protein